MTNRTEAFQKGVQGRGATQGRMKAGGRHSRSDDDTPTPQETAAMLEGFGVSQYPPGESFRAQLNQSTPHPLPGSAQTMTTRGPAISPTYDANTLATMRDTSASATRAPSTGTASPEWQALLTQSRYLSGAARQNALPNDANTLAAMRDTEPPPTPPGNYGDPGVMGPPPAPTSTTTEIQYDEFGNAVPDSGGTVVGPNADAAVEVEPTTGMPVDDREDDSGPFWSRVGNFANAAVHSVPGVNAVENLVEDIRNEVGERALEGMNASRAQASGTSHTLNPVTNAMPPIVTGAAQAMEGAVPTPEQAGRYLWEAGGYEDAINTAQSVITDPRGAALNVWGAADTLVTNPTRVWRAGKRIVPAVVRYYRENPGELAKLGVGAAMGIATGSAANAAWGAGTVALRGAATTSRVVRGANMALDVVEDVERVSRTGRMAAGAAETGEDVIRAATRPTARQAVIEGADRALTRVDTTLNRAIAAKENIRNTVMNAPRRVVGLPEADLRIGRISRARENLATRIVGEGDSDVRQLIGSRVGPTRSMPELPDTTHPLVRGNIEQHWRRNALDAVTPGGNPVPEVNAAIKFAEDPLGWALDKLDSGDGQKMSAGEDAAEAAIPGGRFSPKSSRAKSTAKRRMPELSQPGTEQEIPKVRRPGTDESIYRQATDEEIAGGIESHEGFWQRPLTASDPATGTVMTNRPASESPMLHRTTTYNDPNDWYDKKMDDMGWAPGEEPEAAAPSMYTRTPDVEGPGPRGSANQYNTTVVSGGGAPGERSGGLAQAPAGGGNPPAGGGGTPAVATPSTGGGSGNKQTPQYTMGRGFGSQRRGPKARGFWEGRPEFMGATSNYDRLTIRPNQAARGPAGPTHFDLALGAGAGAAWRAYRGRGGAEQNGGEVEGEAAKDPFGDEYNTPQTREEGMEESPEVAERARQYQEGLL